LISWGRPERVSRRSRGHGLSRSAVLGKVHRDDLPGCLVVRRAPTTALATIRPARQGLFPNITPPRAAFRCSPIELTADACRWPHGDPADEDFAFCGARTLPRRSYCADHATLAYRASSDVTEVA
jgi:GcrA cell cycle regulator